MMRLEDIPGGPTTDTLGPGYPYILQLPIPLPFVRRVLDAWEVLRGRAEAVRESTRADYRNEIRG